MTDQLIAKLEAAEAGSRELSDVVLLALGWTHPHTVSWVSPDGRGVHDLDAPSPTESVDDALGLVPEGYEPGKLKWGHKGGVYFYLEGPKCAGSIAQLPATAICAAILRAQAQEG